MQVIRRGLSVVAVIGALSAPVPARADVVLDWNAIAVNTLQYRSFKSLCLDVDDARIYGGIHFRFDQEAATKTGERIGAYTYAHHLKKKNN